ncbi:MAG: C_GCAxxG_C_C family protein [Bacteroidales bacterium]|nr:C_GCAxxG_C_C family protein [Bacteroidales bacterium]
MRNNLTAHEIFESGFNCAQSILYAYGKEYFKDTDSALRLASGFGAGISYRGEMCGAVSGALMVLGLHYGYSDLSREGTKDKLNAITREFLEVFHARHASVLCNRLLGASINTEEGLEFARKQDLFGQTCPGLIDSASAILERLIHKYQTINS